MLSAMSAWLDKAEAQMGKEEAQALLTARLAADMFPLATQVRFSCVQAIEGMCRLTGKPLPEIPGALSSRSQHLLASLFLDPAIYLLGKLGSLSTLTR